MSTESAPPSVACWCCKGSGTLPLATSLWSLLQAVPPDRTVTLRQIRDELRRRTAALYSGLRRLRKLNLVQVSERQELGPDGRYHAVGGWRRAA